MSNTDLSSYQDEINKTSLVISLALLPQDCHAMGAKATSALAIAVVPYGLESKVEGTLHQMLAGALGTLRAAGCNLIGGHTCEGAELSLGARPLVDSPAQHPDL